MARWVLALLAGTAVLPCAAYAQTAPDNRDPDAKADASEVLVTAQRVEQRLQDVPLPVSVVSAAEIEARNVTDLKDLQYSIPGLSSFEYGVGAQYIQMRGVTNLSGTSTIGMYFDETSLDLGLQGDAVNIRLLDMERVEILRGPQATLYGLGSMGGTIRYIPAAPDLHSVGGSVSGEYSSTRHGEGNYEVSGVLNLPLTTDVAGLRLVAGYERIGGFIDRIPTGEANINRADIYSVRGTFLLRPTDRFSVTLTGLYQEAKQPNQDFGVDYRTASRAATPISNRTTLIQGKAAYDLDFAELSVSASEIFRSTTVTSDLSSIYVPALTAPPPFGFGLPVGFIDQVALTGGAEYEIFASEARLASQGDGPFGWQVGATYRNLESRNVSTTVTAPNALPAAIVAADIAERNKSYSVYGEVSYAFSSRLRGIAGVRYFNEHKRRSATSAQFGFGTTDIGDGVFDTINPRFNLSYEFSRNSMVFANVAKGFRSGGFNTTSTGGGVIAVPPSYDPDSIWTYELGTKHQLFGNRLILEASAYRSDWSQVQSLSFAPGSSLAITTNSGKVSGWGADVAATVRPIRALTLTATYGWNDLAFQTNTVDKAEGDPVDGAIRQSWSASLDYRPQLTDRVTGLFRVDYQHSGRGQITVRNYVPPLLVPRPARDLVNLRAGVEVGAIELAAFANNLFDDNTPSIVGPFGTIAENVEQRPRVIGIGANLRF